MQEMLFEKFGKERSPKETVEKIKNILKDLNIDIFESETKNGSSHYNSSRIVISNTKVGTNGKGVTRDASYASAYAEFLERIQNQFLYHLQIDFNEALNSQYGFFHAPDEQYIDTKKFFLDHALVLRESFNCFSYDKFQSMVEVFEKELRDVKDGTILALPFAKINSNEKRLFPLSLLKYAYGSNGMAAGNTVSEATVQAISEIIERYVNYKILHEQQSVPTIKDSDIEKMAIVKEMIDEIEQKYHFKVICKDCSFGTGLPAVAVIFINTKSQKYFVKFGVHPNIEIALSRCLTENFQGKKFDDDSTYADIDLFISSEIVKSISNIDSIFINGEGVYSPNFLLEDHHGLDLSAWELDFKTNDDILNYYIKTIQKLGFNIFIRDVSFLGFPSVMVVVPGMSETKDISQIKLSNIKLKKDARDCLRSGSYIENCDQINDILKYLEIFAQECDSLADHMQIPVTKDFPLAKISILQFKSMLHFKLGRFDSAAREMATFVNFLKRKNAPKEAINYYGCCRDFMWYRSRNSNVSSFLHSMETIYSKVVVEKVITDLKVPSDVLKNIPKINCWSCNTCSEKLHCNYELFHQIQQTIKTKMKGFY